MNKVERLRLFVAVDLPHELLHQLDQTVVPLKERWPQARWAPVDNQHLTVKFLGWAPTDRFDEVREVCALVARSHGGAEVSLSHLGSFPGGRRMRVLWVGLDDPAGLLARIANDLDGAFEPLGFPPEERSFTPHLTLARFKTPVRLADPIPELDLDTRPFPISDVRLYRSHLSPKGARYEVLETFPLARDS